MTSFEFAILGNAAWASLLALCAAAVSRTFPKRPGLAHGLWVLVLVRLVTPPMISFSSAVVSAAASPTVAAVSAIAVPSVPETAGTVPPAMQSPEGPAPSPSRDGKPDALKDASPLSSPLTRESARVVPASPTAGSWPWRSVLFATWGLGAAAWGAVVLTQVLRFRPLLRSARPAPPDLQERTDQLAVKIGLRRSPPVSFLPARIPPMLWALAGPPRVLLPADLWEKLDAAQQETILMHELAHLRRRDHWVRWLEAIAIGAHWWTPIAWWSRRQIERAEEQCCDAWVVWALPEAADAYAEALVATAAFLSGSRPPSPPPMGATGAGRVAELRTRLTMILPAFPLSRVAPPAARWAMIAGLALLSLLPGWAPAQPPATAPATSPAIPAQSAATPPSATTAEPAVSKVPSAPAATPPAEADSAMVKEPPLIGQPVVREIRDHAQFLGTVEPIQSVDIRTRVSGVLTAAHCEVGQIVEKGAVLFEIDRRQYQLEAQKIAAEGSRAKQVVKRREIELANAERLFKDKVLSKQEVDLRESERDEAVSALEIVQSEYELALLRLESTRITAPLRGRIQSSKVHAGDLVSADQSVLATVDSDSLCVEVQLSGNTVLQLSRRPGESRAGPAAREGLESLIGLPVDVNVDIANGGGFFPIGKVESIDARFNPQTGTLRCRAPITENTHRFLPGLVVQARLPTSRPYPALIVPPSAVMQEVKSQGSIEYTAYSMLFVNDDDVVDRREVILGETEPDGLVVTSGLKKGDRFLNQFLKGTKISIEPGTKVPAENDSRSSAEKSLPPEAPPAREPSKP